MCTLSQQAVTDILKKGNIYEVGGAVRDRLLKRTVGAEDRDYLVCGIPYNELSAILKMHGRVDLVGRSFGVIKFTQKKNDRKYVFDISLPRKEYSFGSGHRDFEVSFDPDLNIEEDLARRDFTINAMAFSLDSEELIDPLNGRVDLDKRQIRMVSEQAFLEDPLRMMRAVQFAARLDFEVEENTIKALKENATLIKTVSVERIAEEFNKLLVRAKKPSYGFRLMQETGLLKEVLPELEECVEVEQPGGYHKYDVFEHSLYTIDAAPARLVVRMAALFHDISKPQTRRLVDKGATFYSHEKIGAKSTERIMKRLRYSREMAKQVSCLVDNHMFTTAVTDKGLRRLIKRVGKELIFDLLDLRRADVIAQGMGGKTDDVDQFEQDIRDEFDRQPPFGLGDLAIDGKDIMNMFKLEQSPKIGEVLSFLI
jgi:putative nucleotidyltransferase with HDIG domain